ncbi:MAG: SUMF1/EgtB/PvdO family nonheme iron enzyme [Myxococcales bacterium]|nr:SUMF1/EgtB/PvdO family nonheme iron enzyme [Myxococcales bacterium]
MSPARAAALALLLAGCAPHEQETSRTPTCPEGMVYVEGGVSQGMMIAAQCVDATEVTTAAYGSCVAAEVCTPALRDADDGCNLLHGDRGAHPINCVTYDQARAYCDWLGKRLPDDPEWAWIARGGARGNTYPWGQELPDEPRGCWGRAPPQGTCEVGASPAGATADGVLDLAGNVAEWTHGQPGGAADDGRVARGGAWYDGGAALERLKVTDTRVIEADTADVGVGLRCVVGPQTPVRAADTRRWTPATIQPRAAPIVAPLAGPQAPTRPLRNLAPLWHHLHRDGQASRVLWPLGDEFVAVPRADAASLGLTRPLDLDARPTALHDLWPSHVAGPLTLMRSSYGATSWSAFEWGADKVWWTVDHTDLGRSYTQVITPRAVIAHFYGAERDVVVAYALVDGHERWRVGGEGAAFGRLRSVWGEGAQVFLLGDQGLSAVDVDTGAPQWTVVDVGPGCGVVTGADVIVIEDRDGHRVIERASGAVRGRIPSGAGKCHWSAASWEGGVAPAVIAGDALYAFDVPTKAGVATLRARELATGAERWRRSGLGVDVLEVDHDAVFVARKDDIVVALDAATGTTSAEVSVAGQFTLRVAPGGGEAGPLVVVDATSGAWILGRLAEPAVPEDYTVTGRLVPEEGMPRRYAARVEVRVGEVTVRSDASGRFRARGQAIGAIAVERVGSDEPINWSRVDPAALVDFERREFALVGDGLYDLDEFRLYERSLE